MEQKVANTNYTNFLEQLDARIKQYESEHADFIRCKKKCSLCCGKGDYPLSQIEFEYLMQGYIALNDNDKKKIQHNIEVMEMGEKCPFLDNNECSVYKYRPIVCRVHGLAYNGTKSTIVPFCANLGLNYSKVYKNKYLYTSPIADNLDTPKILENLDYGEIRTMYDWFKIT